MKHFKAHTTKIIVNGKKITFCEFCQICNSDSDEISEMISYGLLDPKGRTLNSWCFTIDDIIRVQRAKRLQHDLSLNLPGATFALELLDEIKALREKLLYLEKLATIFKK